MTSARERSDNVYDQAVVWDAHAGVYPDSRTDLAGLENWRQAGVSFVSLNVAYDIPSWEQTFPVLAAYRRFIGSHPDRCLLYTSPSPRDQRGSRMPSSA